MTRQNNYQLLKDFLSDQIKSGRLQPQQLARLNQMAKPQILGEVDARRIGNYALDNSDNSQGFVVLRRNYPVLRGSIGPTMGTIPDLKDLADRAVYQRKNPTPRP